MLICMESLSIPRFAAQYMLPPKAFQPAATLRCVLHLLIMRSATYSLALMSPQSNLAFSQARWPAAVLALVFTAVLLLSPACSLGCQFAPSPADAPQSSEHHHDASAPASAPVAPCGTHPHPDFVAKSSATALLVLQLSTAPVVFHSAASAASTFPGHLLSSAARSSSWSLPKEPVLPHLSVLRI